MDDFDILNLQMHQLASQLAFHKHSRKRGAIRWVSALNKLQKIYIRQWPADRMPCDYRSSLVDHNAFGKLPAVPGFDCYTGL